MSDLTEEKKLVWLGLKRAQQDLSEIQSEIDKLQNNFEDYETFKNGLDENNISDYSGLETYLKDNGFTQEEADAFITKIQNNFDSYSAFEDYVENEATSFAELKNEFSSNLSFQSEQETADGQPVGGIRIHETDSVTYDGVSVPGGTVEVYGNEIHFSRQGAEAADPASISFSNLRVDKSVIDQGETVTVSVDMSNSGGLEGSAFATLIENGVVTERKNVSLDAGESKTVTFDRVYFENKVVEFEISTLGPVSVTVTPPGFGL